MGIKNVVTVRLYGMDQKILKAMVEKTGNSQSNILRLGLVEYASKISNIESLYSGSNTQLKKV